MALLFLKNMHNQHDCRENNSVGRPRGQSDTAGMRPRLFLRQLLALATGQHAQRAAISSAGNSIAVFFVQTLSAEILESVESREGNARPSRSKVIGVEKSDLGFTRLGDGPRVAVPMGIGMPPRT
jgi:hypothetical protein